MKIAIYSDTCFYPQVNGVGNTVRQSALALAELGHEVYLFTVSEEKEEILEKMVDNKFKIHLLPSMPFPGYKGERLSLLPAMSLKQLKSFNPDIIHVHTPFSVGWEAVACAKILGVPLVGTHHTFFDHYLEHVKLGYDWAKDMSWKYTIGFYNRCDLILNPSEALNSQLVTAGLKKPNHVLVNPIDTELFRMTEKDDSQTNKNAGTIVYMGRLSYEKSIDKAIRAFKLASDKLPELELLVIGDGPEKENLENLAKGLGIKEKVKFTGYLFGGNLVQALNASDVFITASASENQPVSVLEAMACGLPVVACRAAGLPEIVEENVNGFLTEPGLVQDMADSIIKLMEDARLRANFSKASRQIALSFSRRKVASKIEEYYQSLNNKKIAMKICLYLEFYNFMGGWFYKKIGTGLLSSYKNQKRILESAGINYTEKWEKDCNILQINTPWLKSLYLIKKAKRQGKKVIIWSHISPEDMKKVFRFMKFVHPIIKKYLLYAYSQADLVLCPTEYTKGLLINHGLPEEKLMAFSNGVDLERYCRDSVKREAGRKQYGVDNVCVGTVALIIPRKGIDTFLSMAKCYPKNKFIWVGKKYSRLLVEPLPKVLPENCVFTGFVDDLMAPFNALDIFIFPSYEENEGMAILEAAALGLPILVRDIPVYEGWLKHNVNCLKAKNDEEFQACLNELINNKELRERLGAGALEVAKEKSKQVLAKKICDVYDSLIKKHAN